MSKSIIPSELTRRDSVIRSAVRTLAAVHYEKCGKRPKSAQLDEWHRQVTKLCAELVDSYPSDRIHQAVEWYVSNWRRKYVPDIRSGGALRRKFSALEAAADRLGAGS